MIEFCCIKYLYCAFDRMFLSCHTAQKMKFSIKDFFSKCDQIRWSRRIWSHLLNKSLMENFIFWAVSRTRFKVNLHSIVSWMSRSFFLKTGAISDALSDRNGIWTKWDFVYELSGRRSESRCSHEFSKKLFLMLYSINWPNFILDFLYFFTYWAIYALQLFAFQVVTSWFSKLTLSF